MTDNEMRIVTAKECGLPAPFYTVEEIQWGGSNPGTPVWKLPDYPKDLNAMHEAVMAQPPAMRIKINYTLMELMKLLKTFQPNDADLDRIINATARQRCEAFLRVKGKWKD